ncbi:hypothetical protein PACTADRAFT_50198 [Pachysolen tannophilus NRRL Y-2460]|uniref:Vacuolar protein sorting-associated protein 62 n=1 Tax=Pachysolen tannophilus NRRL Y-2460 TaxID=669874 RepID=A0A1E4TUN7_PACTA|nr:hypothetical protein PACTADRAFT_50198 [Pachysolen tannophilus NRRL Y-2460]
MMEVSVKLLILVFSLVINVLSSPIDFFWAGDAYNYTELVSLGLPEGVHVDNAFKSSVRFKGLPPIIPYPLNTQKTLKTGEIPQYVIDYSPVVHLYSEEKYLPYDIKEYVKNFHAEFEDGTKLLNGKTLNINDLSKLSNIFENPIFLTSNSDFDNDPDWITGVENKPNIYNGKLEHSPAILIVVDKGNGWVDAFWFYFYSFNLGPFVMGVGPFGNHVGDWEHSLVRFYNGKPYIVWMSAHGGGNAYFYDHMEKLESDINRPVLFSARGTHANYASVGQHAHDLPYSILSDFTDRGLLWDPSKNYLAYTAEFNPIKGINVTYANGSIPNRERDEYGDWLNFRGYWGNKQLPGSDKRQVWSPFGWKYINGPAGPLNKNLDRVSPCQRAKWWNFWGGCNVRVYVKMGNGIESEGNNGCGNFFKKVKPFYLKKILELITYGGGLCWILDLIYG